LGSTKDEVTGEWRTLHNEELNDLYPSPVIIQVIKSRRWKRHVAHTWSVRKVSSQLILKKK